MTALAFCLFAALLALAITKTPTRTYGNPGGLSPVIYPEYAKTDAVKLSPGTYAAGTVLGQVTTLTGANDVQTVTFSGTPTGGTFRLSFYGVETGNIAYSGTAATLATNVQTALEAHRYIGTGNVTVAANSGAPQITFQGELAARWQPLILFTVNGLTGGTDPTATVAHTTPGRAVGGEHRTYDDSQSDGTNIARCILQHPTVVTPDGKHYTTDTPGSVGLSSLSASAYIKGYFRTADLTGIDAAAVTDLGRIVQGAVGSLSNVATILWME